MNRALVCAVALAGAACGSSKPACSPEQRTAAVDALRDVYARAARQVIDSGECDKVQHIEECVPYRVLENHFALVAGRVCQ